MRFSASKIRVLACVVFGVGSIAAAPSVSATTCTPGRFTVGDCDATLTWAGAARTFHVHVPASYTGAEAKPLLLDLHGVTSSGIAQRDGVADVPGGSGQKAQSDKRGFIAVFPDGLDNSWDAYGCCGSASDKKIDDVGFLREVIRLMKTWGNIDAKRVYVTGLSNGGGLTHRMACEASDVVTAVAPVSFPLNKPELCHPSRAISETEFRGTSDEVVFYYGGIFQPATWSQDSWRKIDGCSGTYSSTQITAKAQNVTYTDCRDGTRVGLVTVVGGKHVLYVNSEIDIADYIWTHLFKP